MKKKHKPTKHHRKPRSLNGGDDERNVSIVPCSHHEAWHTLFMNNPPEAICAIINSVWLDPDYELVCRRREHAN